MENETKSTISQPECRIVTYMSERQDSKMRDKRLYERVNVGINATIYINGKEFPVILKDISENGIAFLCKNSVTLQQEVLIGDTVGFQSLDNYTLSNITHKDLIFGYGKIIRFDDFFNDGSKVLGLSLKRPNLMLQKYIYNKKAACSM